MKALLGRNDVNPDKPDNKGQTPLSCAAKNGHVGVVEILLGRGDVKQPNNKGQTPLSYATRNRHTRVIALLQPPAAATQSTS